jgi:hypothetical protein
MIKLSLSAILLLLFSVSFADELGLTKGYVIQNVQLVDTANGLIRFKGMDVVISLTPDQIQYRQVIAYDPSKPSSVVLDKKLSDKFMGAHNIEPDTSSRINVLTEHGESIRCDFYQEMDSTVVFHTDYGLITIAKNLIVEPNYLNNKFQPHNYTYKVTTANGESFDGRLISSTDSTETYQTNIGSLTLLKKNIKDVSSNSLDNRSLLFGDTFQVTMFSGESFEGVLLSSTDSSETYRTKVGSLTILKKKIKNNIMTVCGAPLDAKYLLFGDIFTVITLNGESYNGKLLFATDSSVTYVSKSDTVSVLKKSIMTVLNSSLENKLFQSRYTLTVAMINKESFHGNLLLSTDSTVTYQTNTGIVTLLKRNITTVANTINDLVSQITEMNIHLPSLWSVYIGAAIPAGNFAETSLSGGGARTGYTAGIQFFTGGPFGLLADISFSSNSVDGNATSDILKNNLQYQYISANISVNNSLAGNWTNIVLLTGLKIGTENTNGSNFYIAPMIGLDLSMPPKLSGDYSGNNYSGNLGGVVFNTVSGHLTQTSASNIAFVAGAAAEAIISDCITVQARYISGKLNYNLTCSDNISRSFEQNISLFQLCIGAVILK